jgi:hypothetical protein
MFWLYIFALLCGSYSELEIIRVKHKGFEVGGLWYIYACLNRLLGQPV